MHVLILKSRTLPKELKYQVIHFKNIYGQVSLDFIVGTVIFMVTFIFLFQVLTNLFIPFQSNSDEIKSTVDRVAMTLVESTNGLKNSPDADNVISIRRAEYLNGQMASPLGYVAVLGDLGLTSSTYNYNLNISLCNLDDSIYLNSTGGTVLHNGPIFPQNINVASAIRIVFIEEDEKIAKLYVRVW